MSSLAPDATVATTVHLAAAGDEVAFARIVAAHRPEMVRVAFVVCGDWDMAQDAAQAALWIAWRKLPSLHDPERLRPWLLAVVANEARAIVRHAHRHPVVELSMSVDGDGGDDPGDGIGQVDLSNALHRLVPEDRAVSPCATSPTSTPARSARSPGDPPPASAAASRARSTASARSSTMAETDVFERRLRAALVRHTDGGPTDFDALGFARLVAEKEPRRHGLGAVLGWRAAGVPRLAWVLLLAGLLTAMVAGTLAVGAQLRRRDPAVVPPVVAAFVCPPGSNPDAPGPVGQERPVIGDGIADMAFDRGAGRVVLLAQLGTRAETWTFDVCTNAWTRMHPEQEPGSPLSSSTHLIYDADSDATIAIDGQSTWVYDLAKDTWTRMGVVPVVRQWNVLTWTYDPVSGLVIAADAGELWSYDVEADAWASISTVPWRAGLGAIAYDASVDRIVAYARGDMWLFDIRAGTWSRSRADTPMVVCAMGWPNPTVVYDEAARRTVVSCNVGTMYDIHVAYDATADRWESLAKDGGSFPYSVFDPVNKRLVGLDDNRDGMVAFQLATRERMVLLGPGEGQPRPVPDDRQAGRRERLKGDGMNAGGTADRLLVGLAVMILAGACTSGASSTPSPTRASPSSAVAAPTPTATTATTPGPTPSVVATYDLAYESTNPVLVPGELDVYAPAKAGAWPVVVMFHGAPGATRRRIEATWASTPASWRTSGSSCSTRPGATEVAAPCPTEPGSSRSSPRPHARSSSRARTPPSTAATRRR